MRTVAAAAPFSPSLCDCMCVSARVCACVSVSFGAHPWRLQDEERLVQRFLSADVPLSLGDLIFQKIQEAEAAKGAEGGPATEHITPKVVEVFSKVCSPSGV